MKDFMASGSFSRGRDSISANASMVFVGNINQSVDTLVKTSHLFAPFPEAMIDTAFFDRFHCYIPGWEIPKMRPEFFTNQYGFIVDYMAEFFREMRKTTYADAIDRFFSLGNNLNQRDTIGVRKTVSGLLKLLYPHGEFDKEAVERCLRYALEGRRRVKEQLKKLGGMEFYDVHFSYIDKESREEKFCRSTGTRRKFPDPRRPTQPRHPPHGRRRLKWTPRTVPSGIAGHSRKRKAVHIGRGHQLHGQGTDQGRLRLFQGARSPCKRFRQAVGARLSPAHCRTAQYRPHRLDDTPLPGGFLFRPPRTARAGQHGHPRQHESRRQYRPRQQTLQRAFRLHLMLEQSAS
jgi:hypothetical protein